MAGPWEDYAPKPIAAKTAAPKATSGPWEDYAAPKATRGPWEDYAAPKTKVPPMRQGEYGSAIEREALADVPGLKVSGRARTAGRNAQIGGAPGSAHLTDNARDFTFTGDYAQALKRLQADPRFAGYDIRQEELGDPYSTGRHLHIAARPGAKDITFGQPAPAAKPVAAKPPAKAAPFKSGGAYGQTSVSAAPPRSLLDRMGDEAKYAYDHSSVGALLGNLAQGHLPAYDPTGKRSPEQRIAESKAAVAAAEREAAAVHERRNKYDPSWRPGMANVPGNLARGAASMIGSTAGEADPTLLIGGPAKNIAARMAMQGGVQGSRDLVVQGLRKAQGLQKSIDPWATAAASGGGAAFEGAASLVRPAARYLGKEAAALAEKPLVKPAADAVKGLYTGARSVANPLAASPAARSVGMFIRKARGLGQLEADKAAHSFQKVGARIERGSPEEQADWLGYLEGASKGMPKRATEGVPAEGEEAAAKASIEAVHAKDMAEKFNLNKEDVEAAHTFRDIFQNYRDRATEVIRRNVGSAPQFIKDYFPHMWENTSEDVERKYAVWLSKQGSGRNLKERSVPTIQEGIAMGLTPKYGIVQTAQIYAENMSRFLETHEVLAFLKDGKNGHAKWIGPGEQVPDGWVPLEGLLTERQPKSRGGGKGGKFEGHEPGSPLALGGPEQPRLGGPAGRRALPPSEPPILHQGALPGGAAGTGIGPAARGREGIGGNGGPELIEDAAARARNITPEVREGATRRSTDVGDRGVVKEKLYASPEVARIYNNHISKPFAPGKNPGETLAYYGHKAAVADMLWKFALSAYHYSTVAVESATSSVASGLQSASRGQLGRALKEIGTSPLAPVARFTQGARLKKDLLNGTASSPFREKLNAQFARAGGTLHMDRDYRATSAKSFYSSLKDGTLRRELQLTAQKVAGGEGAKGKAKEAARAAANAVQSLSGPLFEDIIPKMKMGAWAQNMTSFMQKFPHASQEELDAYAARALDSIDNRFGEMNKDNLFWSKKTQQIAQITELAPFWKFGSLREFLGGLHDIPESMKGLVTGKGISPRTAHVAATAAVLATINGIQTYLSTGKPPEDWRDLAAYRTGGTQKAGKFTIPERALIPGEQKEAMNISNAVAGGAPGLTRYARNSLGTLPGMAVDVASNTSPATGRDIYGAGAAPGATTDWLKGRLGNIALENASQGPAKGSQISDLARFLGVRPAPSYLSGSPALAAAEKKAAVNRRKSATKAKNRKEAQ